MPKKPLIPTSEWKMIRQIAVNYDLSDEATWLLAAIRRHENGRPGLEFGVGGPMDSGRSEEHTSELSHPTTSRMPSSA